jgi:thiamine biosynthesis lipoprotein
MGVPFNITVYASGEAVANTAADAAYRRIKELNTVFSDYDPRSEVSQLTRDAQPGVPVKVSRDLLTVLQRSEEISKASDGAFDVTVGPVVKLWRRSWRSKENPDENAIDEALSRVGYKNISLDVEASTVTLAKPGVQLDFGAIAKGYACDEALRILKEHGVPIALVEAGGDMACGDRPPGKDGWTIAIEPLTTQNENEHTPQLLTVRNCGVASSGDAYQFIEFDGVRYSHIVDPKTGFGLTHRSSVTVVASDATTADALASAVSVLGPQRGKILIEETERSEMLMVSIDRNGTRQEITSDGLHRRLQNAAE